MENGFRACYSAAMGGTITMSLGKRHGRRERIVVAIADDSPEASAAAFVELHDSVRERKQAAAAKLVRQSFRKKKAKQD